MRLAIWTPTAKGDARWLRLVDFGGIGVDLRAVDVGGNRVSGGSILSITQGGLLVRYMGIDPDLGLILDTNGCIKLDE